MKVSLMVVGKTESGYLQKGIDEYLKRLGRYVNFEFHVIPLNRSNRNSKESVNREILKIISSAGPGKEVILLDERGKLLSSVEFSQFLKIKMLSGLKELLFLTGGPFGFSEEIHGLAGSKLSLSKMTFSHQMVRLLFLEQLYRAFTILKGEPYHHD